MRLSAYVEPSLAEGYFFSCQNGNKYYVPEAEIDIVLYRHIIDTVFVFLRG